MIKITDVYWDMDGTIADMNKGFFVATGKSFEEWNTANTSMHGGCPVIRELFRQHIPNGLFLHLEPTPLLATMAACIARTEGRVRHHILTAIAFNDSALNKTVRDDKIDWLIQNYGKPIDVITVDSFDGKSEYASDSSLLIDDNLLQSCVPFRDAGGWSIPVTDCTDSDRINTRLGIFGL
jgi:hypothetical protein